MTDPTAAPRRPVRTVTVAAVLFLALLVGLAAARSWRDLDRARNRETELEAKVAATRERNAALDRRIQRLRDDPLLLERLAREQLGLVKDGDVVFVLPEDGTGSGTAKGNGGEAAGGSGRSGGANGSDTSGNRLPPTAPPS